MGFEYLPFTSGSQQIRLLTLNPGRWDDEIDCTLTTVPFPDTGVEYEALSYTWGDAKAERSILLDAHLFGVTENLWLALRRLRDPLLSRTLWIDAICINQGDDVEKSYQVSIMGKIYQRCKEGLLWLGEDLTTVRNGSPSVSETGKLAFELLELFASDKHLHDMPCFLNSDTLELRPTEEFKPLFEATARLFELPWWRRIWIVQELTLPRRATFIYASEKWRYENFERSIRLFAQHCRTCCTDYYERCRATDPWTWRVLDPLIGVLHSLVSIRNHRWNNDPLPLVELRLVLCSSFASDQRDLFYGLLGFMSDENQGFHSFIPDYTLDSRQAITEFVVKYIQRSQSLSILYGLRCPWDPPAKLMPTWLPQSCIATLPSEWAGFSERRFWRALSFNASRNLPPLDLSLSLESSLFLKAMRLDEIQDVGAMYEAAHDLGKTVREWAALAGLSDTMRCWPKDTPPRAGSLADAFWKTIVCNRVDLNEADGRRPLFRALVDDDYPAMREWLVTVLEAASPPLPFDAQDGSTEKQQPLPPLPTFWNYLSVDQSLGYRKFFITKNGLVGLAPHLVEPGDQIYVLIGANVPFILRPRKIVDMDLNQSGNLNSFTVIGDGYVHGIMEGEALEGVAESRFTTIKLF